MPDKITADDVVSILPCYSDYDGGWYCEVAARGLEYVTDAYRRLADAKDAGRALARREFGSHRQVMLSAIRPND